MPDPRPTEFRVSCANCSSWARFAFLAAICAAILRSGPEAPWPRPAAARSDCVIGAPLGRVSAAMPSSIKPRRECAKTERMGPQVVDQPRAVHRQPREVQRDPHLVVQAKVRQRLVQLVVGRRIVQLLGVTVPKRHQRRSRTKVSRALLCGWRVRFAWSMAALTSVSSMRTAKPFTCTVGRSCGTRSRSARWRWPRPAPCDGLP